MKKDNIEIKVSILILFFFILLADLSILLNISILRIIIWSIFITILPGLFILHIFKLKEIGVTEKLVLSTGLSISFLMFFGLAINNFLLYLGYQEPLSTFTLVASFNVAFIVLAIADYKVNKDSIFIKLQINLSMSEKAFLILPFLFPSLSIFGVHIMNITGNNIVLMILLFLIPIYVIFVCYFNHKFPKRIYPIVIFLISISLLLMFALRSNHIIGVDRHLEYYYFLNTFNNLQWSSSGKNLIEACLSSSLLPTVYQSILSTNEEYLYKILTPMLISISPLIVYIISKKYVGEFYAFLAAFFFISQYMFSFPGGRTQIAILFFVLTLLVMFNDELELQYKKIMIIIFIASSLVSHYSSTYLFFLIFFISLLALKFFSTLYNFRVLLTPNIIILFFTMIFLWYSLVTEVPFRSGVLFIKDSFISLQDMFMIQSRSETMQTLIGINDNNGASFRIELVFTWITFLFIAIGFITTVKGYKEMIILSDTELLRKGSLMKRFEIEYVVITLVCLGLLALTVTIPFISKGYDMNRIYSLIIALLCPFFILGGTSLSRYLKINPKIVILVVLVPYFLCIFGPIHNIFDNPRAITLNSEGKFYEMYFVHDQDSYGAQWLGFYGQDKKQVYSDLYAKYDLISQAGFVPNSMNLRIISINKIPNGYIFLRYFNVINNVLIIYDTDSKITTSVDREKYESIFLEKNYIYNNGGSEVYA